MYRIYSGSVMGTQPLLDELEHRSEEAKQLSFDQLFTPEAADEQPTVPPQRPVYRPLGPVTGRHQDVCLYVTVLLKSFVELTDAGLVRDAPFEVRLNRWQIYQPDIVFISNANFDRLQETYIEGPPNIIVEVVSPESTALDRGEKFAAYEEAGVQEYWLIDPTRQLVNFYHLGPDGFYDEIRPDIAGRLRSRVLRRFVLDVDRLWQRVLPTTAEAVAMAQEMLARSDASRV